MRSCFCEVDEVRILVTGATGFLGSACLLGIRDRQWYTSPPAAVRGAVRKLPASPFPGIEYSVVGDIDEATDWQRALADVQVVIHTAGLAHRLNERGPQDPEPYRRINFAGTVRLAAQAISAGVKRLVFVSSVAVNGTYSARGHAFTEADLPQPHNAYAASKWQAEQQLVQMSAASALEVVIIRPPLVYGLDAPGNFGVLARAVRRGWPLPLGAIHNERSFVGLSNLVDFLLTCATDVRAANQTFLISDGHDLSTTEFVRAMARAGELRLALLPIPAWVLLAAAAPLGRTASVRTLCRDLKVSSDKARGVLGWTPPLTLDEGLRHAMMPAGGKALAGSVN